MVRATKKMRPNGRSPGVKEEIASRSRARRETQAALTELGRCEAGDGATTSRPFCIWRWSRSLR